MSSSYRESADIRRVLAEFEIDEEVVGAIVQALASNGPIPPGAWSEDRPQTTMTNLDPPEQGPVEPVASSTRFPTQPVPGLDRYEDLGPLGTGGMGEVRRVRDRRLGRTLAMKVVRPDRLSQPALVARFLEEAQATAQLQHPGIVPVHDLGQLPDGRLWFTMKEVTGRTLGQIIRQVHRADGGDRTALSWGLRDLVDAFRRVCEAVAYAHSRSVVHRDLKPSNLMLGEHGEVLVVDWGLAKVLGRPHTGDRVQPKPVQTQRSATSAHATQTGQISGTPAYMSPEQASGQIDRIDTRSDVYSLGAVLFEILAGKPPYVGQSAAQVIEQVLSGPPSFPTLAEPVHPGWTSLVETGAGGSADGLAPTRYAPLLEVCRKAMARDPDERFASAGELAHEVTAWLNGVRQADQARAVLKEAASRRPIAERLRGEAERLRAEAADELLEIELWRPESAKVSAWAKDDAAAQMEQQAGLVELEIESLLRGSLTHTHDLPEAYAALAEQYRAAHEASERASQDTSRLDVLLRQFASAMPEHHPDRRRHLEYLDGRGALSLVTEPPGAEVELHRYVDHQRRLVPEFVGSLGPTPLRSVELERGSYLCILRHPERAPVRYPVFIERQQHWDGVPPGGEDPLPIRLPLPDELDEDERYVPAGWFWSGSTDERFFPRQRLWVDGIVFRRNVVTNQDYIAFLDDLVAQGRVDKAMSFAPQERSVVSGSQSPIIYGFDGQRFTMRADAQGHLWKPLWPVVMVTWYGAVGFAAWMAERTGKPWRLAHELEWEKAARGVDARLFPWGMVPDASRAWSQWSHSEQILPREVGATLADQSPYGLMDVAGNVSEWCVNAPGSLGSGIDSRGRVSPIGGCGPKSDRPNRVFRGGAWCTPLVPLPTRAVFPADAPFSGLSFRVTRPFCI